MSEMSEIYLQIKESVWHLKNSRMKANSITILQIGKTGKLQQQIAKENAKKKYREKTFQLEPTHYQWSLEIWKIHSKRISLSFFQVN